MSNKLAQQVNFSLMIKEFVWKDRENSSKEDVELDSIIWYTVDVIIKDKSSFWRNKMVIETERLFLREYMFDDFNALFEIVSDSETDRKSVV